MRAALLAILLAAGCDRDLPFPVPTVPDLGDVRCRDDDVPCLWREYRRILGDAGWDCPPTDAGAPGTFCPPP